MSVSLYRWTKECEQDPQCVGDCDLCRKETMIDKYDEAGIPATGFENALEYINAKAARPMMGCAYPDCESCYVYRNGYCTVPMVISKQIWHITAEKIARLEKGLAELDALVTEEILGFESRGGKIVSRDKEPTEELNFTWADYFKENE